MKLKTISPRGLQESIDNKCYTNKKPLGLTLDECSDGYQQRHYFSNDPKSKFGPRP